MLNNTHALPFAYCYRCWYGLTYPSCDLHCARVLERYFKTLIPPEDVAGRLNSSRLIGAARAAGFQPQAAELIITGLCAECAAAPV